MVRESTAPRVKKGRTNKLLLGFAGATAAAVIGTAGVAAAQSLGPTVTIPSKAACDNFKLYGFKNRGQCVSAYEHGLQHGQGHGNGYGGSNNQVNTAVTVNVNGNNNVVDVVISYLF